MADQAERDAAARIAERLAQAGVEAPDAEGVERVTGEQEEQITEGMLESVSRGSGNEETAAEETQPEAEAEEFTLPDLDPKLPEDLAEELEMPDWDAEDVDEGEEAEEDDEEWDGEEQDPRVLELKRKLRTAEKRIAWEQGKKAEAQREKWKAEALKYLPLSEYALDDIKATSRRGYLREAKKAHDAIKPVAMRIAQQYAEAHKAAKDAAIAEGRQAAEDAWGKPTVSPGGRDQTTAAAREEKVKQARTLDERVKARLYG